MGILYFYGKVCGHAFVLLTSTKSRLIQIKSINSLTNTLIAFDFHKVVREATNFPYKYKVNNLFRVQLMIHIVDNESPKTI